jgi:hypothetical protein
LFHQARFPFFLHFTEQKGQQREMTNEEVPAGLSAEKQKEIKKSLMNDSMMMGILAGKIAVCPKSDIMIYKQLLELFMSYGEQVLNKADKLHTLVIATIHNDPGVEVRDEHKHDYLHAEGLDVEWDFDRLVAAGWSYSGGCTCDICEVWHGSSDVYRVKESGK